MFKEIESVISVSLVNQFNDNNLLLRQRRYNWKNVLCIVLVGLIKQRIYALSVLAYGPSEFV